MAIADASSAISYAPDDVQAYVLRGKCQQDLGNYDYAIEDYSKAVRINPNYANAYYFRGNCYHSVDRNENAIEDYQQAVKIAPDSYSGRLAIQRLKDLGADIVLLDPPRRTVDMFRPKIPSQTIKKHFVKIWSEMIKR